MSGLIDWNFKEDDYKKDSRIVRETCEGTGGPMSRFNTS